MKKDKAALKEEIGKFIRHTFADGCEEKAEDYRRNGQFRMAQILSKCARQIRMDPDTYKAQKAGRDTQALNGNRPEHNFDDSGL